ncbi:MAG: hypothetical protein PHT84_04175, partial [Candidatus Pacebacteria bacterium]|nr:hypothetical protein [Candidatus Paceibacterota bacterium]
MQRNILGISFSAIFVFISLFSSQFAVADYKDDIEYTKLLQRYFNVTDGSGIAVYHVEAVYEDG